MKRFRQIKLIGLGLLLVMSAFVWTHAAAQPKKATAKFDPVLTLEKAYRQPMLAERITKNYSMIGQKVLENRARRQLDESTADFESGLNELEAVAPTAEIKENYQLLKQLWRDYRALITKPVSLDNAKMLAELNEELVWIASKGATLTQEYVQSRRNSKITSLGEAQALVTRTDLIADTNDGRALTQRIAKLYLFRSWGIRSEVIAGDLKKAVNDYRTAIDKLLKAPQNDEQIKNELQSAETQWIFLKEGITRLNTNSLSPMELEYVAKSCDNIQESLERISGLYLNLKIAS